MARARKSSRRFVLRESGKGVYFSGFSFSLSQVREAIVQHIVDLHPLRNAAAELVECGYVHIPVSAQEQDLVGKLQEAFPQFLERHYDPVERTRMMMAFPGEEEPDDGLLRKQGDNVDNKWSFHYRPTTLQRMKEVVVLTPDDYRFFYFHYQFFEYSKRGVLELLGAVDQYLGFPQRQSLHDLAAEEYFKNTTPYAAPANRQLHYPPQEGERRAGVHIDRAFMTRHLGDIGGTLFRSNETGEKLASISPQSGEALYFWGLKAWLLTKGQLPFLWHGSCAHEGEERLAILHFAHIKTVPPVMNAKALYEQYRNVYPER